MNAVIRQYLMGFSCLHTFLTVYIWLFIQIILTYSRKDILTSNVIKYVDNCSDDVPTSHAMFLTVAFVFYNVAEI